MFWENAISWTIFYKAVLPKGFDIILTPLMDHFLGDPILYIFWGILPYFLHVQYFYPALFQSCPVKRFTPPQEKRRKTAPDSNVTCRHSSGDHGEEESPYEADPGNVHSARITVHGAVSLVHRYIQSVPTDR